MMIIVMASRVGWFRLLFMTSSAKAVGRPRKLTMAKLTELLFESAVTSAVNAFFILLMGKVALAIVGRLFQRMWPAPPPGMGDGSAFNFAVSSANAWAFWKQEVFFVLFFILFALSLLLGLARHSSPETARLAGRLRRLGRRFNEEWFGLIVGNAFGALIAASVLTWVQQFW